MIFKRAVVRLRAQDWVAISIEVGIVIVGVFVGRHVNASAFVSVCDAATIRFQNFRIIESHCGSIAYYQPLPTAVSEKS